MKGEVNVYYSDYYTRDLGDGLKEHSDHGLITYTQDGLPVDHCPECKELVLCDELDYYDDMCEKCYNKAHTCVECGEFFVYDLQEYQDEPYCKECYVDRLERTMAILAKQVRDIQAYAEERTQLFNWGCAGERLVEYLGRIAKQLEPLGR